VRVGGFQNPGVCQQAFPSFLPLPLLLLAPFSRCNSLLPNLTETLATQVSFWQVGVVIIMILRASVLSADEKPKNNFYTRFYTLISSFKCQNFRCFGLLPGGEFADRKSVHN